MSDWQPYSFPNLEEPDIPLHDLTEWLGSLPGHPEPLTPHHSGETLPQELRSWDNMGRLHDSEVVHQFPDQWTVQRHNTAGSAQAAGHFMHNCWQGLYGEGPNKEWPYMMDQTDYMTLHDQHGLPRAAFYQQGTVSRLRQNGGPRWQIGEPLGARNQKLPSSTMDRIQQYADTNGVHFPDTTYDKYVADGNGFGGDATVEAETDPAVLYAKVAGEEVCPHCNEVHKEGEQCPMLYGNDFTMPPPPGGEKTANNPSDPYGLLALIRSAGSQQQMFNPSLWSNAESPILQQPNRPGPTPDWMDDHVEPKFDSSPVASRHTGQIPGDENYSGEPQVLRENDHAGVNPSYIGHVNNNPVYIKPEGEYHENDIAKERSGFAVAHALGVPMPHTTVQKVTVPQEYLGNGSYPDYTPPTPGPQYAQIQEDKGGNNLMREYSSPSDFCEAYPDESRRIALMDHVIDNGDRHMGNIIRGADGQIYPIDHGGGFQLGTTAPFYGPGDYYRGQPLSPEEMDQLRNAQKLDLGQMGLNGSHQEAMNGRIQKMLDSGEFLR